VAGYARAADGAYIAYQTVGEGPIDLAWQPDLFSNVDALWQIPKYASWFRGLASFARLILHDRRCTGASSRSVDPPNLETRVSDCLAVLDATRSERPVPGGQLEGERRTRCWQPRCRGESIRCSGGIRLRGLLPLRTTRGEELPRTSTGA